MREVEFADRSQLIALPQGTIAASRVFHPPSEVNDLGHSHGCRMPLLRQEAGWLQADGHQLPVELSEVFFPVTIFWEPGQEG